eukprot:maker-scaffold_22-snap-gene-2.51-mRNA-1 protein AED:0.01 eAED:0.01 QI:84/1/1/1/1/1/2/65/498
MQKYFPKKWKETLTSFINGEFAPISSQTTSRFSVNYTAKQIELFQVASASKEEVDRAIQTSLSAQKKWKQKSPTERSRVLNKIACKLTDLNDEIAYIETIDTSRVISETKVVDVISARDAFEYSASAAQLLNGQHVQLPDENFGYTIHEPLGVVAGIGAWNYPIQGMAWKVAPALAAGNGVVFKPSEETILSSLRLAEVIEDCGVPKGLVNVVLGKGDVGKELVEHSLISKVAFTGSLGTGIKITQSAANSLKSGFKPVSMELGGKSPLILFEDCDLEEAVKAAIMGNFYSNGEVCSNGTRIFVHSSIKEQFLDLFVKKSKLLRVGDPLDEKSDISSLISANHFHKVNNHIKQATEEGAKLVLGGDESFSCCVSPTIFDKVTDEMSIAKEEVFGPVASVLEFETEDEVIQRVNNTPFGLAGGIFTRDIQRAHRVVKEVDAGVLWINNYNLSPVELPWGGFKLSGTGHENGIECIKEYTKEKSIYVEMNKIEYAYSWKT